MLQKGFDCYSPVTHDALAMAVSRGYSFVARYYDLPGSKKMLLPVEARRVSDAGLRIFSVFEHAAGDALKGGLAGTANAAAALAQAAAVGQPRGSTICFAVDTDPDMTKAINKNMIHAYFNAVGSELAGKYRVGAYGGGEVLDYLLTNDLISVAWLAGAMGWRGSKTFEASLRWHLKQGATVKGGDLGIEYDPNVAVDLDKIGSWTLSAAPPVVKPPPTEPEPTEIDLFDLQRRLAIGGFYEGPIDGKPFKDTAAALVSYYRARHE